MKLERLVQANVLLLSVACSGGGPASLEGPRAGAVASASMGRTVLDAELEDSGYGSVIAGVGDLNGDGYDDVAIGAPLWGDDLVYRAGRVYVHLGGPDGLDELPNRILSGVVSEDRMGMAIAGVGDINGDGRDDLAIGVPYADTDGVTDAGQVQIYLGTETGVAAAPVHVLKGTWSSEWLGFSISKVGDLDNNGAPDVVVGAPGYEGQRGRTHLFLNTESALPELATQIVEGTTGGEYFGHQVAILEDIQGDGIPDLAVASPYRSSDTASQCGQVFVYPGSGSGVAAEVVTPISAGLYSSERLGWTLISAGDLDQDGFGDLIAAAPYHTRAGISSVGRVAFFRGSTLGLVEDETLDIVGWTGGEQLGWSMALAEDPEGDGVPRLLVGAPYYDGVRDDSGRVDRYTADLTTDQPDESIEGASIGLLLGTALASGGDIDGDGQTDMLLSTRDTTGLPGRVEVIYGAEGFDDGDPGSGGSGGDGGGAADGGGGDGAGGGGNGSGSGGADAETDTAAPASGLPVIEQDVAVGASCASVGTGVPALGWLLMLGGAVALSRRRRCGPVLWAALLVGTALQSTDAQARDDDDLDGPRKSAAMSGFSGLYLTGIRYTGDGQLGARGLHTLRAAHLARVGRKPFALGFDVAVAGSNQVRDRYTPSIDPAGASKDDMPGECWFSACTAYAASERVEVRHVPLGLTAAFLGEAGRFGFVAGGGPSIHLYRVTGSAAVSMTDGTGSDDAGPRSYAATATYEGGRSLSVGLRLLAGTTLRLGELGRGGGHWGLSFLTGADFALRAAHDLSAPMDVARYYQSGKLDLEAEAQNASWKRGVDIVGSNLSYSFGLVWLR